MRMRAFIALTDFVFACMQILDELIIAGELQESSKKSVLRVVCTVYRYCYCALTGWALKVTQSDSAEEQEASDDMIVRISTRS
jgi:AP-1 complex subunit sigma 1/2